MTTLDCRAEALRRIPAAYSLALRLCDAGLSEDLIAECLGTEPEALGPLLVLAEAKLAVMCRWPSGSLAPRRAPGAASTRGSPWRTP